MTTRGLNSLNSSSCCLTQTKTLLSRNLLSCCSISLRHQLTSTYSEWYRRYSRCREPTRQRSQRVSIGSRCKLWGSRSKRHSGLTWKSYRARRLCLRLTYKNLMNESVIRRYSSIRRKLRWVRWHNRHSRRIKSLSQARKEGRMNANSTMSTLLVSRMSRRIRSTKYTSHSSRRWSLRSSKSTRQSTRNCKYSLTPWKRVSRRS